MADTSVRRPLLDAFMLGQTLSFLWYGKAEITGTLLAGNLDTLLYEVDRLGLGGTYGATLRELRSEGLALGSEPVSPGVAAEVRSTMVRLSNEWARGLALKPTLIGREGMFSSEKLLNDPLSLLPEQNRDRLPEIATFDLVQGARCLVFDLPTAGAFHMMRAAETSLRLLYAARKGSDPPAKHGMGDMLKALKDAAHEDPLLDLLDVIRKHFRNPTQHPSRIYEIREAEYLMALVCFAISKILIEL